MHYLHHNFYSNFTASVAVGESDMTKDIFVNELSDFIVYDTTRLITAMKLAGLSVSEKDSDERLIDAISNNLGSNPKLASALAFIIAEANQLINNGKTTKEESTQIIKEITSGLLIVGKDIRTDEGAASFKKDVLEHIYAKAKSKGGYNRVILESDRAFGKVGYVFIGLGLALALTIFIAYRVQRRSLIAGSIAASLTPPITPIIEPVTAPLGLEAVPPLTTTPPVVTPVAPIVTPPVAPITQTTAIPQV